MRSSTPDIATLHVPVEDGELAQAFDQLDERLSAWSAALDELTGAVHELGSAGAVAVASPEPSQTAGDGEDAAGVAAEDVVSPAAHVSEDVTTEVEHHEPAGVEVSAYVSPLHEIMPGLRAGTAPEPATAKPTPPPDPDEQLLSSLDEETARAIRIMRRLSPVKKSVRELLAEHQAKLPQQAATPTAKKRSWFSRNG